MLELLITLLVLFVAGAIMIFMIGRRRNGLAASQLEFVSRCEPLFDELHAGRNAQGLLRLEGRIGHRWLQADFVRDQPSHGPAQIWLALVLRDVIAVDGGFAVALGATSKDKFLVSLGYPLRLRRPMYWPTDAVVRACLPSAADCFGNCIGQLDALVVDPCLKEVSLGPAGARLLWQVSAGSRWYQGQGQASPFLEPNFDPGKLLDLSDRLADLIEAAGGGGATRTLPSMTNFRPPVGKRNDAPGP